MKSVIAVIPARGGSKRLARKNIRDFAGKPLIAWTIEAALGSKMIDKVIVSTEDDEIAEIAKSYGALIPFMRPKELAADITTTYEVITHLLEHIDCEYLLLLQPTSPLRTSHHIDEALIQLKKSDSVVSVVKVEHPVEWSNELTINNCMDNFYQGAKRNLRSQDLPVRFRINGAIYAVKVKQFLKEKSFIFKNGSYAYEMDEISSIDIDNEQQFLLALINKIGIDEVVSKLNTV